MYSRCLCLTNLVSVLFDPAIPTSSFNFIQLYIYNERYFSDHHFSYIVSVITWGHGYASWICPVSMNARRRRRKVRTTRIRIGQNCKAVCTKKSGLNASGHRDTLSNNRCESAARFERPAKQALALATEPRAKREARSVLCCTCQ